MSLFLNKANREFNSGNYSEAYKLYCEAKNKFGFDFLDYNINLCLKCLKKDNSLFSKDRKGYNIATIDIIIPIYNALEDVKNCINSLYKHKTHDFNIIAIDDYSDKETKIYLENEAIARGFSLFRNKENLRFTKTVNKGFQKSKNDYVVLLNSDTIVTPRWIEKILACFNSDKKIGIVGPLSNAASWQTVPVRDDKKLGGWLVNKIPNEYSIEEMAILVETISKKYYPKVPSVNGFCYVIKREVLNKNGILDEEYFPAGYGEEDDFSIRAIDSKFKIAIADDTYIYHAKSKSYTHETRQILSVKGRKALDTKHGKKRLKKLVNDWKSEPILPIIANHIESYMQIATTNKKVVYTAIYGDYDSIKDPEYINNDWDYICYTNNKNLKSKTFTIKYVDAVFENQTKNARMIKILSHIFLSGYEYSLWIDGSVKLRGHNIDNIIRNMSNHYISIHEHVKRNCVYEEYNACVHHKKDNIETMKNQINLYKNSGFPKSFGLFETAEIMRNLKHISTKKLNISWWHELKDNSIRDQLSLPYVIWKNKLNILSLDGTQWLDAYFHMYSHKTKILHDIGETAIIMVIQNFSINFDKNILELISKTKYKRYKLIIANNTNNISVDKKLEDLDERYKVINVLKIRRKMNLVQAYNYAVKKREEEYICFLDSEVRIINSDWLSVLITEMIADKKTALAGPTILNNDYSFLSSSLKIKQKNEKVIKIEDNAKLGGTGFVKAVHESCVLIDNKALQNVGYINENDKCLRTALVNLSIKLLDKHYKVLFVLNSEVLYDPYKLRI